MFGTYTVSDGEELTSDEHSSLVKDITSKSAKIAVVTAFQSNSLQDLSSKAHTIPLAKTLGIKHRSKGKHELMVPIAKELFVQGYLEPLDEIAEVNFKRLKRNKLKVCKPPVWRMALILGFIRGLFG